MARRNMRSRELFRITALLVLCAVVPIVGGRAQHYVPDLPTPTQVTTNGHLFGNSCSNFQASVTVDPPMRPGWHSVIRIAALPPNQAAVLLIGTSASDWLGVPLPLSLGPLGLSGCDLYVSPDMTIGFPTGVGRAAAAFSVPAHPALAAQPLFFQAVSNQPGLNSAGVAYGRGYATRIEPFAASTSWRTSISQHGITFTFAQPTRCGQFVNGDWFVIGSPQVVAMSPPCTTVGGRVIHGAMINPDPSTQNQGYDTDLFDPQHYSHARNVAWNLSPSNPLQLQPNQSLIKSISNLNSALVPALKTCAVLTVLDRIPQQGAFRPPYAGSDHRVRHDVRMIDWNQLHSLPAPAGRPDATAWATKFERPWLDHAPGWKVRYLHPADNMPDYGRDLASLYNEGALMCNTDLTSAEKQALAVHLVQIGIDFYANKKGGAFWKGIGGHGSGRKMPILFAGALLGDQAMLNVGYDYPSVRNLDGSYTTHFGEDSQTFYVEQTSATEINWGYGGYGAQHLGMPEFGHSHVHSPNLDVVGWTTNSYRLCCTANAWIGAVLCARMMGLVDEWSHPALFDYTDRYVTIETVGWTKAWSGWCGDMWDTYRPLF